MNRIILIILTLTFALTLQADDSDFRQTATEELISKYQEALQKQQSALTDLSMEVLMEGKIPKLKREGKLSAIRKISNLGKITYKVLGFWGDDTVKKEVMARYMTAEVEAAQNQRDKIGINEENYNFKYKGLEPRNNRQVHVFELKPKHKRLGLFKGELWLDPDTCLPIREAGRLVKNPSVFIKKMEFVRDYEIKDGVAYLRRMESKTDTRIVGRAELNIEYANFRRPEPGSEEPVDEARGLR